jgi:propionate CoA-transferase
LRVLSAEDAARLIPDGATVVLSGNGSLLAPECVLCGVEHSFRTRGVPRELTLYYPVVVGTGPGTGVDRLAHPGLVRAVVASCFDIWGIDRMAALVRTEAIIAHCLPMGVMFQLLHAAADGQPGVLTPVGLDTFVDPAVRGTGQNARTRAVEPSLAERWEVAGRTWLFYRAPRVNAAILRGSVADEDGNVSLYREPIQQAALTMALAARAHGGVVIVQVQAVVRRGSLAPERVTLPGALVDAVVVDPHQRQSSLSEFDPRLTGEWAVRPEPASLALTLDKVVARRAALELGPGMLVNLGFGLAALVAQVAAEEGVLEQLVLSVEHGPLGGMPTDTRTFGAAVGPHCVLRSTDVFALYHSGQLDLAILSAAEVDQEGNSNVSRFGDAMPGPGGYIDITGSTPRLVLLSALQAGGARVDVLPAGAGFPADEGPGLRVRAHGRVPRFVPAVRERTFSARAALARGAQVAYITDRCTFALTPDGLMLTEVAPGIDPERDVLSLLPFRPAVAPSLRRWPACLFVPGPMGLRRQWQAAQGAPGPEAPAPCSGPRS